MTYNVDNYFEQTGSSDNTLVLGGSVETSTGQSIKQAYLNVELADVSTAGSAFVVSPVAGTISKMYSVINGAIATDDAAITPAINGTGITDGGITIANAGSAAGDVDSSTPTALNVVAVGDYIEFETDGASTNTIKAVFTVVIDLA